MTLLAPDALRALRDIEPPARLVAETRELVRDAAFDGGFAAMAAVEPPGALVSRVADAVAREARPRRPAAYAALGGALALAAAVVLSMRPPATVVAPAGSLVERGEGVRAPEISLEVAVAPAGGGAPRRASASDAGAAGDVLAFAVRSDVGGDGVLRRDGALVWAGPISAGRTEVPVAWGREPGEGSATFELTVSTVDATSSVRFSAAPVRQGP